MWQTGRVRRQSISSAVCWCLAALVASALARHAGRPCHFAMGLTLGGFVFFRMDCRGDSGINSQSTG